MNVEYELVMQNHQTVDVYYFMWLLFELLRFLPLKLSKIPEYYSLCTKDDQHLFILINSEDNLF